MIVFQSTHFFFSKSAECRNFFQVYFCEPIRIPEIILVLFVCMYIICGLNMHSGAFSQVVIDLVFIAINSVA